MENVASIVANNSDRVLQLREDWRLARAARAELVRLGLPRTNVLLTGSEGTIAYLLDALLPDLREPVGRWCPGEQLLLPPPALIGTMIFQDVGEMPLEDQHRLLHWLSGATGRTQVVSTASASLVPDIESGVFLDALYYRLNVLVIDASS